MYIKIRGTEKDEVVTWLEKDENGWIDLMVSKGEAQARILSITSAGTVSFSNAFMPELEEFGFPVDKELKTIKFGVVSRPIRKCITEKNE